MGYALYDPPKDVEHCEVPAFLNKIDNIKLLGPQGSNFKRITEMFNIKYLWLDLHKNIIEIYCNSKKQMKVKKYLEKYMATFYEKHCKNSTTTEPPRKKQRT